MTPVNTLEPLHALPAKKDYPRANTFFGLQAAPWICVREGAATHSGAAKSIVYPIWYMSKMVISVW